MTRENGFGFGDGVLDWRHVHTSRFSRSSAFVWGNEWDRRCMRTQELGGRALMDSHEDRRTIRQHGAGRLKQGGASGRSATLSVSVPPAQPTAANPVHHLRHHRDLRRYATVACQPHQMHHSLKSLHPRLPWRAHTCSRRTPCLGIDAKEYLQGLRPTSSASTQCRPRTGFAVSCRLKC